MYRFDVTGAQWNNVTSAGQVSAQLPPMTAQGSADGGQTWQDLGQLMPSAAPAVAAYGSGHAGAGQLLLPEPGGHGDRPGVWTSDQLSQCPAKGDQPVTEVRVVSGGLASSPVTLAGLAAPPLDSANATPVQGISTTPTGAPGAAALPRADGVNQAGLTLALAPLRRGRRRPATRGTAWPTIGTTPPARWSPARPAG